MPELLTAAEFVVFRKIAKKYDVDEVDAITALAHPAVAREFRLAFTEELPTS